MSIISPILLKVAKKNKESYEILEGMKAVKSETTDDSVSYAFEFSFKDNSNRIRIHIAVNLMVVSITFNPNDKEQMNWVKNGGNNEYGMSILQLPFVEPTKNIPMSLVKIKNKKVVGWFGKKNSAILTVTQTKKIKDKQIDTVIFKEPILDNYYSVSTNVKGKKGLVSAVFGDNTLSIYSEESDTKLDAREIPCLSTGFIYTAK